MDQTDRIFMDGEWVRSASTATLGFVNPATEELSGTVPAGAAEDVEYAVAAAKRAFPAWSATEPGERIAWLRALAAELRDNVEEIAVAAATDVGTPVRPGRQIHALGPAGNLQTTADALASFPMETRDGDLGITRDPVGVVACITPWNYPLHQVTAKIAPALAAGCTVTLKPSEVAPLSVWRLMEAVEAVGLPPGVVNLVSGTGPTIGEALVRHPDVEMVSFTGSARAGSRVAQLAAGAIKRATLELGGKSANIVLDDVSDLGAIVEAGVASVLQNSGQTCSALTRMLVPRAMVRDVCDHAVEAVGRRRLGDPMDEETDLGPLVSAVQRDRVRKYIQAGIHEGARLVAGGLGLPEHARRGFYVAPTVFCDVRPDMIIARHEIFGPVLSIMSYETEHEAVELANDTPFGLSGAVWSADVERAERVAKRLRTGQVKINGGAFNPAAPFGGYKQSGIGRELGAYGLEEFLEVKALLY
ncbi:MAG: aldehyde dehydrogenase [Solirubrobacteraceae bacterium]|nr:aldehyde dehydrogenase [Solirubrobacteraceae bacterium]